MLRQNEIRQSDVFTKADLRNIIVGLVLSARQIGGYDEITRAYIDGILIVAKTLGISIAPSDFDFNGG